VLEGLGVLICSTSPGDGTVRLHGNPASLFGFAPRAIPDSLDDLLERVHPDDRDSFLAFRKALSDHGSSTQGGPEATLGSWRYRVVTHDMQVRWLEAEAWLELDAQGSAVGTTGVIRDLTALHQAQQEQQEIRRRLEAVFDHTFEFIGLLEPGGTVIEVNRTALAFVGVEREQVIGKLFWQTPWWSDSELEQSRLRDGIHQASQGTLVRFETWHTNLNSRVTIDFSLKPVHDDQHRVVFIVAEGRDITARVRGENERERLLEQFAFERSQFEAMLEQMPLGVGIVNAQTERLSFVNAALERVLGCPIIPGQRLDRLNQHTTDHHGQPIAPIEQIVRKALMHGEAVNGLEFLIEHDDGRRVSVVASGTPIRDSSGQVVACVLACTDISQPRRARLEERLEDALGYVRQHHAPDNAITPDGLIESLGRLYQQSGHSGLEGRLIGLSLLRTSPIRLGEAAAALGVTKVSISRTVNAMREQGDVLIWHDHTTREHRFQLAAGVFIRDLIERRTLSWAMAGVLDNLLTSRPDLDEGVVRQLRTQLEAHVRTATSLEHHLRPLEHAQARTLEHHLENN
jgi:PAS domain S-box-containing protein